MTFSNKHSWPSGVEFFFQCTTTLGPLTRLERAAGVWTAKLWRLNTKPWSRASPSGEYINCDQNLQCEQKQNPGHSICFQKHRERNCHGRRKNFDHFRGYRGDYIHRVTKYQNKVTRFEKCFSSLLYPGWASVWRRQLLHRRQPIDDRPRIWYQLDCQGILITFQWHIQIIESSMF